MGRPKSTHDREVLTWLSSICASAMGDPRSRRGFGCDPTVRRRSSISVRLTSPRSGCQGGSGVAEASSTSSSLTSSTVLPAGRRRPRRRRAVPRASTSRSSSATRPGSCFSGPRRRRWNGGASTSRATTSFSARSRTTSSATSSSRSGQNPTRSPRSSRRKRRRLTGPTSPRRLPPTRRLHCLRLTRSRASSAPPTSGPSTCCSRSPATRSRLRVSCCSGSASRTRSSAAPSSAAWRPGHRGSSRTRRGSRSSGGI